MASSKSIINFNFFLFFYISCLFLIIDHGGVQGSHEIDPMFQSFVITKFDPTYRTGYHFQPPKNWMNDPNGPMYYKGFYHLFYQYNPRGTTWGNIVWAHSISNDLINWKSLEPALWDSKPYDIEGVWSGSITILPGNKPVIFYTGLDAKENQMQNIALPANMSDPYLRKWVKPDYNPIAKADSTMNATFFRDPTTAWYSNGHWKMVVGGARKRRGIAYMYRSKDFRNWVKAKHPLHTSQNTWMWECPDFYPISVKGQNPSASSGPIKYVLKVSLDRTRYEYYTLGTYNDVSDRYYPDNTSVDGWSGLRYDWGNFYASKSFFDDNKNRRVLWGWANESDFNPAKGWAGIQAIPRTLWLDSNERQLVQWPVEELETLRSTKVELKALKLQIGNIHEIKGITAVQADVEVTFSVASLDKAEPFDPKWDHAQNLCHKRGSTVQGGVGPFGLLTLASKNLEEYTPVFFRVFFNAQSKKHVVLMCSDAGSSSLNPIPLKPSFAGFLDVDLTDKKFSLRSLIDHSVVESFGGEGRTCITSRVYPTLAIYNNAHLLVFNNGTEPVTVEILNAWSMKSARIK